ncbi:hypothetical protein HOP50_02g12480 [Chloropicon primus]|nr:hypothetical protein HOP50_02g12480 [Chloropicon primus]|mmetsp:Transcript_2596/g.7142  ORF Transcript_2596/g.7142 Transcript_2596/m.7142 type:complete len:199 (-) Transcript_2596:2422-3018(-)
MAPERVSKKFRKLYGRCSREIARYAEEDALASARLRKVVTIWERWSLLEQEDLYCAALAKAGVKDKVVGKQALVLQTSVDELEGAMSELEDAVEALRQMAKEGRNFVASEYRQAGGAGAPEGGRGEDRTLTIAATDYVDGLDAIFKMHEKSFKLKQAVYGEIKASKDVAEREDLLSYFVSPPCFDHKMVESALARAKT